MIEMDSYRLDLESARRTAITAAKELYYGKDVVEKIKKAKDTDEINTIMVKARHRRTEPPVDKKQKEIHAKVKDLIDKNSPVLDKPGRPKLYVTSYRVSMTEANVRMLDELREKSGMKNSRIIREALEYFYMEVMSGKVDLGAYSDMEEI